MNHRPRALLPRSGLAQGGRNVAALMASLSLAALCLVNQVSAATAQSATPTTPAEATRLTVGLGYIPSVQFAQFYLAEEAGYYDEVGLDVTFQNKVDPELITLLGQGSVDVGMADGTSLIPAVSQGIPVVYGATIYGRFPNVILTSADSGIEVPADLEGRSIGVPGRFGSSWIMLQALLASASLTTDDVDVRTYPRFGQAIALAEGQVDAATGFVNNEPVQLAREGVAVNVLSVDDVAPLPGPGLVVGRDTLEAKGDALRAFTAATLRAMAAIAADPQLGLDATFTRVPELAADPDTQLAILEATIDAWTGGRAEPEGLGAIDRDAWQTAVDIMTALPESVVAAPVTVDQLVTDELLP